MSTSTEIARLEYVRPDWFAPLPPRPSRRPRHRWHGNVAHVDVRPVGIGLVELRPGEFAHAWRRPRCIAADARVQPFSIQGASRDVAEQALAELGGYRPIYPPLLIGGANG